MRLHRPIGGEERSVGGEVLRGVGGLAARHVVVESPRRLADRQLGGMEVHVCPLPTERDALVLPDRPVEHDSLAGAHRSLERDLAGAERF